ncbi:hypothetical protein KP509_04G025200 [Ceratopteris richardii]|uniref:Translocon at the inner envelope membrane of chloroplasts 214 n=1 Tax=Ceratopteris richardii TaxID=49495 RepID=A0A8T2UYL9_CERRI|nr:hypothetical protein KP509_04G025200 [Ceratopteris richardii]
MNPYIYILFGVPQLLCIRSFLIGGNLSGLASLSGPMLAQLITFLSIYCSPIYLVLSKPHILTVMDPPDYQLLRPVTSFRDSRLLRLFVLTAFSYFSKLLLTRVERDSPMLYLLVKCSIYTTFSIVFVSIAMAYLGRAPAPFFIEKYVNQFYAKDLHFWKLTGYKSLFWWAFQPWPFSFFDPTRHNRGHRFVRNSRLYRGKSFVKRRVSTYFFQKCLTDGKERLSFASLPKKLVRTKRVEKELTDRVVLLDNDYSFSKAMEKRTRLKSRKRSRIPQVYDPFVNNFRMRIPIPHTYLTLAELNMKRHGPIKERKLIRRIKNKEYLKDWISKNSRRRKKQYRYKRMFQFMYEKGTSYDFKLRKILEKTQKDSSVICEEMIELNPLSQALFFTYLERENSYYLNTISTMRLARNLSIYSKNVFDFTGAETAFRYRKLCNIGFTSIRRNRYKWVKRYARVSDFRRKLFKGSLRARRRKTLLWNALQGKIHSSFFLRVREIPLFYLSSNSSQLLENSPALKERLINEESTRTHSALATRTDIGPIHNGRGYLLVFQSKFCKYIKLPTFILFKTIIRFLLRQESEWSKDWTYWRKEIHINCTFDGEEYSRYDLPPRWLREGYQTDKPFGPILKETSFWKPVQKKLIRTYQKRRLPRQVRQTYQFINSRLHLEKVVKFSLIVFKKLNFLSKIKLNRKNSNQRTKKLSSTLREEINHENNVVPKNGVQLLSQGQLYVDIWNISLKNNLNLDLLTNNNIKNSNNSNNRENIRSQGDINQDNNTWSSDFNHSSKFHVLSSKSSSVRLNSTLTKIQNIKENGINRFPIHSNTKIDNREMPNEILSENTAKYIEEWGFWNKFYNVNDEIWSNWLDCFPKYNLSSIIWREIAPSRWKGNLEDFTNLKKITTQNNPRYRVYPGKFHSYSIYTQKKYNLKFDLMLWLDPKMLKMKGLFTSKNKTRKTKRLLEDKPPYYIFRYGSESDKTRELFKYLFDRGIEDREESDYLFNRKWKLEMQMESFRKLSDITRLLRTEQELMALCENSELDPDLLGFQLRNKNKNRWFQFLGFFYFHRFRNLLDDQSLLYKIVNPLLNVKSIAKKRDKKRLYKNIYNDTYIFRLFHMVNEHCKQVCNYNIEDLLLTRRQREFRFLNCLVISKQLAQRGEGYLSHIINEIEKTKNVVEEIKNEVKPKPWCLLQDSSIESQRIKRFLWPSHRLEELACTGRFCFGATTESRFAALKIRMYPII